MPATFINNLNLFKINWLIGEIPSPRRFHTSCLIDDWMIVHGGDSLVSTRNKQKPSSLEDLYALDLNTFIWYKLDQSLAPLPLCGHSISRSRAFLRGIYVDCLILFGGYCSQNKIYSNMMHICDVEDIRYAVRAKIRSSQSAGASGGAGVASRLFVEPGAAVRWRSLKCNGKPPSARYRYLHPHDICCYAQL